MLLAALLLLTGQVPPPRADSTGALQGRVTDAATTAPVMFVPLPGRSRRQGLFIKTMQGTGRVRPFEGQFTQWPVTPLDDTPLAAHEMRRRLGL